jgi:hypothetical protein
MASEAVERVTMILRQGLRAPDSERKPTLFVVDSTKLGGVGTVHGFGDARYTVVGFLDINTTTRAIVRLEAPPTTHSGPWSLAGNGAIFPLSGDKLKWYSTLSWFLICFTAWENNNQATAVEADQLYLAEVRRGGAEGVRPMGSYDDVTSRWLNQLHYMTTAL